MKKIITLISVAAVLLFAFSCKKASYEIPDKYKAAESLAVKGSASVEFDAVGGSYTVSVKGNDAALEVSVNSDWLSAEASGQDVKLSCPGTMSLLIRYATVTIKSQGKERRLQVKQYGVSNDYLWEESYEFPAAGGDLALKFIPTSLSIKLKVEGSEWIKASVTENTLNVTVAKNETAEERSGKVIWQAGEQTQEFAIVQAKGNGGGGGGTNPPVGGVVFSEDFENEDNLDEWRFIDLDGDTYNWMYSSQLTSHSGIGMMFSQSYINDIGPLEPDNWAFTPAIQFTDNNYLSFWVTAQDQSYPDEHYAVYIAGSLPQSQSDLDAMTKLHEATYPGGNPAKEETITRNGKDYVWQQFVVKIPDAFAGKSGYIVFRHFDCTDCYYLNLDDVMVTVGAPSTSVASTTSAASANTFGIIPADFFRK